MKATTLEEVMLVFNTRGPLIGQQLDNWFVERRRSPRRHLNILLSLQERPQKILFVGHRGSGKSTELSKLSIELQDKFFPIGFEVLETTGRTNLDYEDLMLAISTQVTRNCVEASLVNRPVLEPVQQKWNDILEWWQRVVAGQRFTSLPEVEIGVKLNLFLMELEAGIRQSSETRQAIKHQVSLQMSELIRYLNWIIEQAEASLQKKLLLIVEGLDKVDLASATTMFLHQAATLVAPIVTIIYTFPVALRYSADFNNIRANFDRMEALPNITTHDRGGQPDQQGLEILRTLVLNRMEERLIQPDALRLLIAASGGIPNSLVFLIQNAALYALTRDNQADTILREDAGHAIITLREQIVPALTEADWRVLQDRHRDYRLTSDADNQILLNKGALIEYPGNTGQPWCDAHQALWDLLQ